MKKVKVLLASALTVAALFSLSGNTAAAFEGGGHQGGYCFDNQGHVWTACNFPNGICPTPIWCKDSKPSFEEAN